MRLFTYFKIYAGLTKNELLKYYKENKITVNGKKEGIRYIVKDSDIIMLDGKIINSFPFEYYLYYKPKGILSIINDSKESYINNINIKAKMSLAGRLDKDSEGLMILTNDGKFINELMKNDNKIEKEYIVTLKYPITDEFMLDITKSHILRNKPTTPIIAKKIDEYTVSMILFEGFYHQIRKIVIMSKNSVVGLKRIRINNYVLGDLKPGEIKKLPDK